MTIHGKGLFIGLSETYPTVLRLGDEQIELTLAKKTWAGKPTVFIKAERCVDITGPHLVEKKELEIQALNMEIERMKRIIDELGGSRMVTEKDRMH